MSDPILACHLHDYLEIACLYGFEVRLKLNQQADICGKAMTTKTSKEKKETLNLLACNHAILHEAKGNIHNPNFRVCLP